jgi:hypothetical protein
MGSRWTLAHADGRWVTAQERGRAVQAQGCAGARAITWLGRWLDRWVQDRPYVINIGVIYIYIYSSNM